MKVDLSNLPHGANLSKEAIVFLVQEQIRLLQNELSGRNGEKKDDPSVEHQQPSDRITRFLE